MAKFMVLCSKVSGSVFVKGFFLSQGGGVEDWGKNWVEVEAESIEDARRKGCQLFAFDLSGKPWARPYERQAK
jgi:hypothetical protein